MKEEIKEILELLAFTDENIMFCDIVELNSKRSHLLLDYITNLQEENRQTKLLKERYQLEKEVYKQRNEKALAKINNMFDLGNENTIIDDLLQLENILKGDKDV